MRSLRIITRLRQSITPPTLSSRAQKLPSLTLDPGQSMAGTGSSAFADTPAPTRHFNTRRFSTTTSNPNPSQNQKSFSSLFQFIKKNPHLPEKINDIHLDNSLLRDLHTAISIGDPHAQIFKHPQRDLLLLKLIQHGYIPHAQGMTIDTYFTALMQYTADPQLKKEDAAVKSIREISVDYLIKDNHPTLQGNWYVNVLYKQLEEINFKLNRLQFIRYALTLPVTENWLLKISYDPNAKSGGDKLLDIIIKSLPYLVSFYDKNKNKHYCWFPSTTLIHYLLEKISPCPVQMQDIYGRIKEETRTALHKEIKQPVARYSRYVKNNSTTVHAFDNCGPFPALIHDWGHAFWFNLLTPKQREICLFQFVSILEKIRETAIEHENFKAVERLDFAIDEACDFDLTPLKDYMLSNTAEPRVDLDEYLARTFGIRNYCLYIGTETADEKIGDVTEDAIFFLLNEKYYHADTSQDDKHLLGKTLSRIQDKTSGRFRNTDVLFALKRLAKNVTHARKEDIEALPDPFFWKGNQMTTAIDWDFWYSIFNFTDDTDNLWYLAQSRNTELLT